MRALLSVTDKSGLVDFARELEARGYELVASGGTAAALREAGLRTIDVAEVTGFPEMLGGRLKTLHPKVHGALLGKAVDPEHRRQMEEAGIIPIQLVAVNLYRFEEAARSQAALPELIEAIDIGGPTMIRSAAKNYESVCVLVDPEDYDRFLQAPDSLEFRREMAAKAFALTAFYDSLIARTLRERAGLDPLASTTTFGWRKAQDVRYGENPHQRAAFYADPLASGGIPGAKQLWGKELSYNNLLDADAAWALACDLPANSCAIVKHGNPCGAASMADLAASFLAAREGDAEAAFGGIAALNAEVDLEAARSLTAPGNFLEVVMAPGFTSDALEVFERRSGWGKNVRLLELPVAKSRSDWSLRSIRGGVLVQESDSVGELEHWSVVSQAQPSEEDLVAARFAWTIVRHVKSNAIVVTSANQLLGVGAGQMKRVQAVRLAVEQAGDRAAGAALASDAFFPFPDNIEEAAAAGIRVVVEPGGSKKDEEVIAAANEVGLVLVFTGVRHFRH